MAALPAAPRVNFAAITSAAKAHIVGAFYVGLHRE